MNFRKLGAITAATLTFGAGGTIVADKQINPYDNKGTHYELAIKSDIPQGERVEIAKDRAAMTLKGWNDEYAITIEPQIPTISFGGTEKPERPFTVEADRPLLSKKMEYRSGDVTAFIEPKEGTEGEFDIDFTLEAKPDTNVFEYKIEGAEQFDFFYQPELTAEEIADGASRPENVVGSYAVYHKEKVNHHIGSTNYATGKAFHIYRPKVIDANGAEVWAELSYESGVLSVTVPEKWLETAAYPVVVDPTFGYTTIGGTTSNATLDILRGSIFTSPSDAAGATVSSITLYSAALSANGNVKAALVASSTLNIVPNGVSDPVSVTTASGASWRTYSFTTPPTLAASTNYLLMAVKSNNFHTFNYDAGGFGWQDNTNSYTTPLDPTDVTGTASQKHSIYATYTVCDPTVSTCTELFITPTSATWTAPTDVTSADVACWGGGGGGHDDVTASQAGAGGGGGAFASSTVAVTPGNNYTITIASTSPESLPAIGKFSSFVGDDKTVLACGGTGGTDTTTNGVGGTTACSTGDVESAGGVGGDGDGTGDAGGGGGGAGGPAGIGGAGSVASTILGGGGGGGNAGGAGGQPTAGTAGSNAGGGGAGVTTTYSEATSVGKTGAYGGGGGGGGDNGTRGGNGGLPGGGGGGAEGDGGVGAGGMCTVTYTASGGGGGGGGSSNTPQVIIFE